MKSVKNKIKVPFFLIQKKHWKHKSLCNYIHHFFQPLNLCDIEQITSVVVTKEDEISQKIDIQLKDPDKEVSNFVSISNNIQPKTYF